MLIFIFIEHQIYHYQLKEQNNKNYNIINLLLNIG